MTVTSNRSRRFAFWCSAVLFVIAGTIWCSAPSRERRATFIEDGFGTVKKESIKQLGRLWDANDYAEFQSQLFDCWIDREFASFKKGDAVIVLVDTSGAGLVKVRREGLLDEYWTRKEWLSR